MTKFKLNKKYNHKSDLVQEALCIEEKRADFIVDNVGEYWDNLTPETFMISKILDFVEQQDWNTIEKLYAVERFTSLYQEEARFGQCNDELMDYIIKVWKEKGTVSDEDNTREYLKYMFKLLMGYNLNCLIETLKDIDNLAEKFGELKPDEKDNRVLMTPEQIEKQRVEILMNNALQNIDKAIPDTFGVVVFGKTGYDIISKSPEMTKIIQETLKAGQKNFIAEKNSNLSFYQ